MPPVAKADPNAAAAQGRGRQGRRGGRGQGQPRGAKERLAAIEAKADEAEKAAQERIAAAKAKAEEAEKAAQARADEAEQAAQARISDTEKGVRSAPEAVEARPRRPRSAPRQAEQRLEAQQQAEEVQRQAEGPAQARGQQQAEQASGQAEQLAAQEQAAAPGRSAQAAGQRPSRPRPQQLRRAPAPPRSVPPRPVAAPAPPPCSRWPSACTTSTSARASPPATASSAEAQSRHDELVGDGQSKHDELLYAGQSRYDELLNTGQASTTSSGTAQSRHDELVSEATTKHEQMITEARERSTGMVHEAQQKKAQILEELGRERSLLEKKIDELRTFERDYRARLKNYIEEQLADLDADRCRAREDGEGEEQGDGRAPGRPAVAALRSAPPAAVQDEERPPHRGGRSSCVPVSPGPQATTCPSARIPRTASRVRVAGSRSVSSQVAPAATYGAGSTPCSSATTTSNGPLGVVARARTAGHRLGELVGGGEVDREEAVVGGRPGHRPAVARGTPRPTPGRDPRTGVGWKAMPSTWTWRAVVVHRLARPGGAQDGERLVEQLGPDPVVDLLAGAGVLAAEPVAAQARRRGRAGRRRAGRAVAVSRATFTGRRRASGVTIGPSSDRAR